MDGRAPNRRKTLELNVSYEGLGLALRYLDEKGEPFQSSNIRYHPAVEDHFSRDRFTLEMDASNEKMRDLYFNVSRLFEPPPPKDLDMLVLTKGVEEPASVERYGEKSYQLYLPTRVRKTLDKLGATTISGLLSFTKMQLLAQRNFGVTSLFDLNDWLASFGVHLKYS